MHTYTNIYIYIIFIYIYIYIYIFIYIYIYVYTHTHTFSALLHSYNATDGFFLRDLRGDSYSGVHAQLGPAEYLAVLQQSKFCLAPSGMGFSTRVYESIAQGCVPLIIQDDPFSNTSVNQAFEELLPYERFSLRLKQSDIPSLPAILRAFPLERWRELRANLACVWPRILWLQPDNEAPGVQGPETEVSM